MTKRVGHLAEDDRQDPFEDLKAVETLTRARLVEHEGSVHQVVAEQVEEEPKTTANAKYWPRPRVSLGVARRFIAMVITLGMLAAGTGGMTVATDPGLDWIRSLAG